MTVSLEGFSVSLLGLLARIKVIRLVSMDFTILPDQATDENQTEDKADWTIIGQRRERQAGPPPRGGLSGANRRGGARTPGSERGRGTPHHGPPRGNVIQRQEANAIPQDGSRSATGANPPVTTTEMRQRTVMVMLPRNNFYTRIEVAQGLSQIMDLKQVEAIGMRQQNHVWFITTKSTEAATALLTVGVIRIKEQTGYISTLSATVHRARIHWTPYYVAPALFKKELQKNLPKGATVLEAGFERSQIKGLEHIATMVRYAIIHFDGKSSELPHTFTLTQENETIESLITIQGRMPMCLRCRRVGHMRNRCVLCSKCGDNHPTSECQQQKSYANAIKGIEAEEQTMEVIEVEVEGGDRVPPEAEASMTSTDVVGRGPSASKEAEGPPTTVPTGKTSSSVVSTDVVGRGPLAPTGARGPPITVQTGKTSTRASTYQNLDDILIDVVGRGPSASKEAEGPPTTVPTGKTSTSEVSTDVVGRGPLAPTGARGPPTTAPTGETSDGMEEEEEWNEIPDTIAELAKDLKMSDDTSSGEPTTTQKNVRKRKKKLKTRITKKIESSYVNKELSQ